MTPKLKVGDTFIYTKEMNDAKIKSSCFNDNSQYIGKLATVKRILRCYDTQRYDLDISYDNFHCNIIDPYLPINSLTPNIMSNLVQKFKSLVRQEPEKSFIKAGVMDEKETLTSDGTALFHNWLFTLDLEKLRTSKAKTIAELFKSEVVDKLLEEQEDKK
jgi:hypothetical protein